MNDQNNQKKIETKNFRILFIGIFIGLILILGLIFFNLRNKNTETQKQLLPTPSVILTEAPQKQKDLTEKFNKGYFKLKSEDTAAKVGKPFSLLVTFDSGGEEVVGVDILVKFDKEKLKFLSAKSNLNEFSLYPTILDNYLNLTFVKNLNIKTPTYLNQSNLVTLQFEPLLAGKVEFEIVKVYKNRKSFFVNEKTEIIYPKLLEKLVINIE